MSEDRERAIELLRSLKGWTQLVVVDGAPDEFDTVDENEEIKTVMAALAARDEPLVAAARKIVNRPRHPDEINDPDLDALAALVEVKDE